MSYKTMLKKFTYLFIGLLLFFTFFSKTIDNMNTPRVKTISSKSGYLIKSVRGSGQIVPDSTTRVYLPANLIIDEFLVSPGKEIEVGDPLFKINAESISNLYNLENIKYFKLKAEQYKAVEDLTITNRATHSLEEIKKEMLLAEDDLKSKNKMFQSGFLAKKSVNDAELLYEKLTYQYKAAVDKNKSDELLEERRINNLKRRLDTLKMDLALVLKSVNKFKSLKENPIYKSNTSGKIANILSKEGILIYKETPVLSLVSDNNSYIFQSTIDDNLLEDVTIGNNATLFFVDNSEADAILTSIIPNSDGLSSILSFSIEDSELNGNESGYFILNQKSSFYDLIVPIRSIRGYGSNKFAYVTDQVEGAMMDSTIIKKVDIRVLEKSNNNYAISGNIKPDDLIVYDEDRNLVSENIKVIME